MTQLGKNAAFKNIVEGQLLPQPAYQGEFTEGEIVKYYNPEDMSVAERMYVPYVLGGLRLTASVFFRNMRKWFVWLFFWMRGKGKEAEKGAVTVYYPDEMRKDYSPITRGKHILTMRPNGDPQCVACFMCATACPAFCIHIVAGEHPDEAIEKYPVRFDIEIDKCIFCGYCEEACPVDAIRLTPDVHLVDYRRERMVYDRQYLMSWRPTVVAEEHVYPGDRPRRSSGGEHGQAG
jgi:NADH-quinone oxidoreductase subunit I